MPPVSRSSLTTADGSCRAKLASSLADASVPTSYKDLLPTTRMTPPGRVPEPLIVSLPRVRDGLRRIASPTRALLTHDLVRKSVSPLSKSCRTGLILPGKSASNLRDHALLCMIGQAERADKPAHIRCAS